MQYSASAADVSLILLLCNIFAWAWGKPPPCQFHHCNHLNLSAFQRNNSLNLKNVSVRENYPPKSIITKGKTTSTTSLSFTTATTMHDDGINNTPDRKPNDPKLIAVIGASGTQGGSVVRAFHELKSDTVENDNNNDTISNATTARNIYQEFEIRAITRDIQTSSEKMSAIKHMVKEVVQADCNDYDSMVKAFEGCYGAFVVTNFWPECDMAREIETTNIIQKAAKQANLQHVVLSTFEDTRESPYIHQSGGEDGGEGGNADDNSLTILDKTYGSYVPHFDGKAEAAASFASEVPTTKLLTSFYYENFLRASHPTRKESSDDNGVLSYSYALTLPMGSSKMALVAAKDIGRCAAHLFTDKRYIGTTHGVVSEIMTCEEIASTFSKVFGLHFFHNDIPVKVYASFGFPGAADLANMYDLFQKYETEFLSFRSLHQVQQKVGPLVKLEEWLIQNKDLFHF